MTITIDGLSPAQQTLADMIWAAKDEYDIGAIEFLFGVEAVIVKNMIIAAVLDQEEEILPNVTELLDSYRG